MCAATGLEIFILKVVCQLTKWKVFLSLLCVIQCAIQQAYSPPLSPHTNTPESLRDAGLRTASFGPRGTLADDSEAKGTPLTESECVCSREDKTPMYTISFLRRGLRKPSKQPFTHHCPVSCSSFSFWRWIRLHTREGNTMHVRPNHSRCQNLLSIYQLTPHPSPHTQHRTVTVRKTRLNFPTLVHTYVPHGSHYLKSQTLGHPQRRLAF